MKKFIAVLLLAFAFVLPSAVTASAETLTTPLMSGTIGKYKVKMKLTINTSTNKVSGWYYYASKGPKNKIQLSGRCNYSYGYNEGVTLTETVNGKTTGHFYVTIIDLTGATRPWGGVEGTFTTTAGKDYKVAIYY